MWLKCENIYIKWCSFAYSFRWGLVSVTFSQCLIKKSNIRSCCFRRHPVVDPIVGFHRHHHPVVGFFVFSCVMLLSQCSFSPFSSFSFRFLFLFSFFYFFSSHYFPFSLLLFYQCQCCPLDRVLSCLIVELVGFDWTHCWWRWYCSFFSDQWWWGFFIWWELYD